MTVVSNAAAPQATAPQQVPQTDAASQKIDKARADSFLSLLNIGTVSADNSPAPVSHDAPRPAPRDNQAPRDAQTPPAASAPAPQAPQPPAPRPTSTDDSAAPAPLPPRNAPQAAAPRPEKAATQEKPAASNDSQNTPAQDAAPANQAKPYAAATSTTDKGDDVATRQKKIRDQLSGQLDAISQILQALINALAAIQPTPATPATGDATTAQAAPAAITASGTATPAATPVTDLASLLAGLATPAAATAADAAAPATAPAAAAATGQIEIPAALLTPVDPKDEIALLKDIQGLLNQLRDNVQAVDTATAPAATPVATAATSQASAQTAVPQVQVQAPAPAQSLQTLVTNVQQDIAALVQRLAQVPAGETATVTIEPAAKAPLAATPAVAPQSATATTDATPVLPASVDLTKPQSVLAFLKDSITQVRDRLQSLQQDNEAAYTQAKTTLQQQFEAAQSNFRQTASAAAITGANAPAVAATVSAAATSTAPAPVQTQAQPVSIVIALSPQDTSGGQTGQQQAQDQGQSQNQPAPVASASVSQADNGVARTETPSFAKTVARAANVPLTEQVALQVKNAVSDGTSRIRIQLDPADLGKMDIKLNVDADGKTSLSIMVDNKSTLDLLQRDAASLTRTLNEAGLSADGNSLSFNLRGGQQQNQGQQQATTTYKKSQPEEDETAVLGVVTRNYAVNLSDGLDIQI